MRRALASLGVLLLAATANAGWWDDAGAARRATLVELRTDPGRWRDVVIALDVRFAGPAESGERCPDGYAARDWRAVGVVADDAAPGSIGPEKATASLFVRRGSESERRLAETAAGARVYLRAAVRDAVHGEPWIEILEATRDADPLTVEEAGVLTRADEYLARGNAAAAEALYRALLGKRALPQTVRADVLRKIGASCWAQRRVEQAAEAYASVLALDADDAATARQLAAARAVLAAAPSVVVDAVAAVAAPSVRLLPPAGMHEDSPASASAPRRDVVASLSPEAPTTPPAAEPAVPSPPKPLLAGPK